TVRVKDGAIEAVAAAAPGLTAYVGTADHVRIARHDDGRDGLGFAALLGNQTVVERLQGGGRLRAAVAAGVASELVVGAVIVDIRHEHQHQKRAVTHETGGVADGEVGGAGENVLAAEGRGLLL